MSEIRKLNIAEMRNLESVLLSKKLKFKVKDGIIKRKTGSKGGKSQFIITEGKRLEFLKAKQLTIKQFTQLYNKQLELLGIQSIYTKMTRDKLITSYMYSKNWIEVKYSTRIRDGVEHDYITYRIRGSHKAKVLDFVIKYLAQIPIDNTDDIKAQISKNPRAFKNPDKVNEKSNYREKTAIIKIHVDM